MTSSYQMSSPPVSSIFISAELKNDGIEEKGNDNK